MGKWTEADLALLQSSIALHTPIKYIARELAHRHTPAGIYEKSHRLGINKGQHKLGPNSLVQVRFTKAELERLNSAVAKSTSKLRTKYIRNAVMEKLEREDGQTS